MLINFGTFAIGMLTETHFPDGWREILIVTSRLVYKRENIQKSTIYSISCLYLGAI